MHYFDLLLGKKSLKYVGLVVYRLSPSRVRGRPRAGGQLSPIAQLNQNLVMVGAANGPIYDELTGSLDLPRKTAVDLQPLLKGLAFAVVGVVTEESHGWMLDYLLALSRLRCKCSTLTASDTEHSFYPALESHFVIKRNILASCGNVKV